ncbi:MAG: heavy metal-binding domain-containing protein [Planctomycetia bacterium]|nr:heavy metal-binding domain-containing protein [Planctomycetia bacterium]
MSLLGRALGINQDPDYQRHLVQQQARNQAWETALTNQTLPDFVKQRLVDTKTGKLPWVSTGSVGALLAQRSHGIHPLGMVSGNCWYQYGYSWTRGHYDGWHTAIDRMRQEAALMGANAVVDVQMNATRMEGTGEDQMDYAVLGTAVRIAGLNTPRVPVVATVSALEFARLMEAGILPTGLAIGAHYNWHYSYNNITGQGSWWNQELTSLSEFMMDVRRAALSQMATDAARLGTGVLARVQFSELLRGEPMENDPRQRFLGRHIAFGTAVLHEPRHHIPLGLRAVFSVSDGKMPPVVPAEKEII